MEQFTRYADVVAAFHDPRLEVPAAPPAGPTPDMAWLRATVARFSNGAVHDRRRALVEHELAGLDPAALRRRAHDLAAALPGPDRISRAADRVPVTVLAEALGVAVDPADVAMVATVYLPGNGDAGSGGSAEADGAVARLVVACGGVADEATANRIGILVQAQAATAGLVRNAAQAPWSALPVERILHETLRHAPPVRLTSRTAVAPVPELGGVEAGGTVRLEIALANRDPAVFADPDRFDPGRADGPHLTFGAGPRRCPGSAQALAIAAGILAPS